MFAQGAIALRLVSSAPQIAKMTTAPKNNWQARALELVRDIDTARDSAATEEEMLTRFATLVAEALQAELCVLAVRNEDTGELQLRAMTDRAAVFANETAQALRGLLQKAGTMTNTEVLEAQFALPDGKPAYGVATPLRVGDIPLGALLLLNAAQPFTPDERQLVAYASSQIDSALQHARLVHQLRQRQRELETIYRIDRLRDNVSNTDVMMNSVLAEICRATQAEAGYIMLFDNSGRLLEVRASTNADLFSQAEVISLVRSLSEITLSSGAPINRLYSGRAIQAIATIPLILHQKLIGVLGIVNHSVGRNPQGFTRVELNLLTAIASQIDTAIFESLQTQRLRSAFGRSVGPKVMERLLNTSDRDLLLGEQNDVTILFSDIRGFTDLSGKIPTAQMQAVLNDHFSALSDLVLSYEGTLDKYIGDCVMCFFNAPERQADHAMRGVRLALAMHQAHHRIMEQWQDRLPLPAIGVGISTGPAMLGNFGSTARLEYSAIGPDINLASRLCAVALGDQTLISEATYTLVKDYVVAAPVEDLHLKGIHGAVRGWNVTALRE